MAALVVGWFDGCLGLAICLLSCQRITYAIAQAGILPGSPCLCRLSTVNRLPVNAALIAVLSIAINGSVIGSEEAFGALTATATIATNVSYLVPIVARHTVGRQYFEPAKFNLGGWSPIVAALASLYICFLFVILLLPQIYPVTAVSRLIECLRYKTLTNAIAHAEILSDHDRRCVAHITTGLGSALWIRRSVLVQRAAADNHRG